jgi:hypothetical protein
LVERWRPRRFEAPALIGARRAGKDVVVDLGAAGLSALQAAGAALLWAFVRELWSAVRAVRRWSMVAAQGTGAQLRGRFASTHRR